MDINFQKIIYKPVLRVKANRLGKEIIAAIPSKSKKILDIGCGDMMITQKIRDHFKDQKIELVGLDVINTSLTDMKPLIYDGNTIPFPDKYFDFTYTSFTLHHCDHPEKVLSEIKRVTKNRVLIVEEIYTNIFTKYITYINDWVTNRLESLTVNIPLNFKTNKQWLRIFKDLKLQLVSQKKVRQLPFWFLTNQVIYILKR